MFKLITFQSLSGRKLRCSSVWICHNKSTRDILSLHVLLTHVIPSLMFGKRTNIEQKNTIGFWLLILVRLCNIKHKWRFSSCTFFALAYFLRASFFWVYKEIRKFKIIMEAIDLQQVIRSWTLSRTTLIS